MRVLVLLIALQLAGACGDSHHGVSWLRRIVYVGRAASTTPLGGSAALRYLPEPDPDPR